MKKIAFKSLLSGLFGLVAALVMTLHVSAMTPTLSLTNDGYGNMQVTVYGDANMPIILDYYANGQLNGAGIVGYTNYSGYFSGSLNQSNYYAIPNGAQIFVMVNGQQSATTAWQNYGYNNYNPYQNNNNCYSYNTYYNYNNYPCNNNNYYYNNPISVSNSNVQVTVGNTATVAIYGGNNNTYYNQYNYNYGSSYYVSNNNSNIASTTINGNTLSIYGMNPGTTSVNVCSNNGGNGCTTINVTVNGQYYYNNNGYSNYNGYYQYPYNNNNGYYWYWSPTYNCWMHY